ncbi:hypothetical protein LR48_Vigan785s001400 [Vigna angularis]|uniref:PARP catalytic domain-containing protein n=2 Tax=Phaseolus angularis TaxID=3914 RepID=A0A0L9TH32_PHAAN|nr:uncharacterized protein LOC108322864 [Vigna angularis]KOM29786.1 hypothetical protein LR48_Vigan785s001400 [Vigna angularis]BAT80631.1 hypothetical protein VIGAN_03022400 [Vigna angularis var. angularis]
MHALWVSLKDNVKCGNKINDVIKQQTKCSKGSGCVSEWEKTNSYNRSLMQTPTSPVVSRPSNTLGRLHELGVGDPSRKIVEMIFQKAWLNTSKPLKKVRTVLRVSYSEEVLERFEKYRENVKKVASEQYPRHPRSTVDGNELLRFYGTTVRCFHGKSTKRVHDLCKDPSCYLCQIIQFNFKIQYAHLNASDKELSNRATATARVHSVKKAAIICRIIAGIPENEVDGEYEGPGSTGLGEMQFSLEKFVVKNPSSILPCFVIIFS